MGKLGIFITTDLITPNLTYRLAATGPMLEELADKAAREIQDYAQQNAPWTDRTGEARDSLTATASYDSGEVTIDLAHGVDYGYWLEVIQNGRFAIILPTLELYAPRFFVKGAMTVI